MIETAPTVRRMPVWLSATIIVASLVAGGALIYWYVFGGSGSSGEVVVLDRDPSDSVRKAGADSWIINSGGASLTITNATSTTKKPRFELVFRRLDGLSSDQIKCLSAMRRIAGDIHMRETLSITSDQLSQIRDIRKGAEVDLSDDARAKMLSAFRAYHAIADPKADPKIKDAAETQLINALEQVAKPLEPGANKSGVDRATRAQKILSSEQWAQYGQLGK